MTEVPEHLLKRSQERRKALGLPVEGDEGGEAAPAEGAAEETPAAEEAAAAPAAAAASDEGAITEDKGGVPAHLLERSRRRKAALAGGGDGGAAAPAAAAAAGGTATAVAAPAPTSTGPGGHTQRLLTVVKSGSIQQARAEAQDKVHVWPHLLAIEFASLLSLTAFVTIFSALVKAPLLGLADVNQTPNPSKAPWYFLGLQELLKMFQPMVAGVTIPGIALGLRAIAPYIDKNPSHKPSDRKFAIVMLTMFMMMWATLVIIGSFFRGEGFNFVFPWNKGIFFELQEHSLIIAIVIVVVLLAAFVTVFLLVNRSRSSTGNLSRETRKRDQSDATTSTGTELSASTELEAAGRERSDETQGTITKRGGTAVKEYEPVDEEELGVNRRQFLNRGILLAVGFGLAGFAPAMLAFLWPFGSSGFGGVFAIGTVDDIKAQIAAQNKPFYAPQARTYMEIYPKADLDKAKQVYKPAIYDGMEKYGLVALYQRCVHLGCRVPFCQSSQWFECPCHGSKYNRVGEKKAGPAPRGLDRFHFTADGGVVKVDTGTIYIGPPIGTDTTGQQPEGPLCV